MYVQRRHITNIASLTYSIKAIKYIFRGCQLLNNLIWIWSVQAGLDTNNIMYFYRYGITNQNKLFINANECCVKTFTEYVLINKMHETIHYKSDTFQHPDTLLKKQNKCSRGAGPLSWAASATFTEHIEAMRLINFNNKCVNQQALLNVFSS
jgi:hypothetical protein